MGSDSSSWVSKFPLVTMVTHPILRWGRNQKFLMKHTLLATNKTKPPPADRTPKYPDRNENEYDVLRSRVMVKSHVERGFVCQRAQPDLSHSDQHRSDNVDVVRTRRERVCVKQVKGSELHRVKSNSLQPTNQNNASSKSQPVGTKRCLSRDSAMRIVAKSRSTVSKVSEVCTPSQSDVVYENGSLDAELLRRKNADNSSGSRDCESNARSRRKRRNKSRAHKYQNVPPRSLSSPNKKL